MALLLASGASCERAKTREAVRPLNTTYMQLVSLSTEVDDSHLIPITDRNASTWYREEQPGLDLGQCIYESATVHNGPNEMWSVALPIRGAENGYLLNAWLRERVGSSAGVILGGRLVSVFTIQGSVHGYIWITAFTSEKEAATAARAIRSGGYADAHFAETGDQD